MLKDTVEETEIGTAGGFQALPVGVDIDDRTAAYILRAQVSFELLRNAAAQLAGLLVLASIGSRERVLDEPLLERAENAYREAEDKLRGAEVPAAAAHHHYHMSMASKQIREALRTARQGSLRLDGDSLDRTHQVFARRVAGHTVRRQGPSWLSGRRFRPVLLHCPLWPRIESTHAGGLDRP